MKLIVGLGNPGAEYRNTRHNVGFAIIDKFVEQLGLSGFQKKFHGEFIRSSIGNQPFVLLKPSTYMNLSGESVGDCARFFKIPVPQIVVISDDLELIPGQVRLRINGGHGGHNGLRSIIDNLSSNEFKRIRVGLGRPPGKMSVTNHVLGAWKDSEYSQFQTASEQVVEYLIQYIQTSAFENTSISVK